MALELNEPLVRALRDRLEDEPPAEVAAINAAIPDAFALEAPAQVLGHVPTDADFTAFPVVGITDGSSRFEDDTGWAATGVHELIVVAFLVNPDQEALAWQLRRYAKAIARVALRGRSLDPSWEGGVTLVRVDPGPSLANEEDPRTYFSWIAVTIQAKREEQ